jgi:hypothetical protein
MAVIAVIIIPGEVSAETVQWSGTMLGRYYRDGAVWQTAVVLDNPVVQVEERASMTDMDTAIPIACGASIPLGTRVRLSFDEHRSEDISWFGTGGIMDSPYGDWTTGASEPPAAARCVPKNYVAPIQWFDDARYGATYIDFVVDPPAQSITGLDELECTVSATGAECTASAPGTFEPTFRYAQTLGHFFGYGNGTRAGACYGGGMYLKQDYNSPYGERPAGSEPDSVVVPSQAITCPITVVDTRGNRGPNTPSLAVAASASCSVGTPHTVSFSATDPDGDPVRYLIDWNDDGVIDQLVPTTGYMPSGSVATASRTFSTDGSKTIRVKAQDSRGMRSASIPLSFSCARPVTTAVVSDDSSGNDDDQYVSASSASASPDLTLRAVPSLVHPGDVVKVSWSATHVSSCTVDGTNGDVWDTIQSAPGGNSTSAIHQATIYRLRCLDTHGATLQKSVTVNILPNWQEQ